MPSPAGRGRPRSEAGQVAAGVGPGTEHRIFASEAPFSRARLRVRCARHLTHSHEPPEAQTEDPTGALHKVMGPTGSFYRSPDQI